MGLDIKKLREMQKDLKKKSGDGDSILLFSNKLPEELDIRILPPKASMNGIYFLEQEGWWINGNFYLVDADNDVIKAEIDAAKALKDKTLTALIEKKKEGMPLVKREVRYTLPILTLKTVYDDNEELQSCDVEDVKVLVAKPTLIKEINKIVTARPFQNGTKDGIADRVKGYNIIIGKQGKGLDTEYVAMGWNDPMEMPEKFYEDKEIPDVVEMAKKAKKSDAHLTSVIRNYLYGEEILKEEDTPDAEDTSEETTTEEKPKSTAKPTSARPSTARPSATPKETVKPTPKAGQRSLLDDAADDMDMD